MENETISLKNLKKLNKPFELPEGYFDNKADQVFVDATKVKFKLSVKNLLKKAPFIAPAGYFQQLPNLVLERVRKLPSVEAKVRELWPSKRSVVSSIAAMIVMGFMLWLSIPKQQGFLEKDNLAEVSTAEMYSFLTSQEVSAEEVLENKDLSQTVADSMLVEEVTYSNSEIIEFLEDYDENIELSKD